MEFLVGTLGFSCMLIALAALVGEIVAGGLKGRVNSFAVERNSRVS